MQLSLLLLSLVPVAPVAPGAPGPGSLLASVPEDAYALVHCRDFAALRTRAERNDWYRLLGSEHGEPLLAELAREFRRGTHNEMDEVLTMAAALEGEVVFFDTGAVAGFVTAPPANRAALTELMRGWMPHGDAAARRTREIEGGTIELIAWPDEIDGWTGRAGHFAAFVDHPRALAIYSGDDSAALMAALTEGLTRLDAERRAPLVASYLASGGGSADGIELFIDFTPFIDEAEAAVKQAVEGVLPDPSRLLGLQGGTWLLASADVFPGTRVDCRAQLRLPADTLAARLADTFKPLPHTLPADLPGDVWALWALDWDLKLFYQRIREAYEEADRADGLAVVDGALQMAQGASGVDPIVDVLNQLDGDFAFYFVHPESEEGANPSGEMEFWRSIGFHAGVIDGGVFRTAFEKLIGLGGLAEVFELQEVAGVEAYVAHEEDGFDGGVAFVPRAFSVGSSLRVLERGLQALTRVEGASLLDGSRMQAAIDENAGACFLWCVEMTPLRAFWLPEVKGDLPPLEDGQPTRDPFDSQLISTARRTPDGFELRLHTR